MIRLHTSISTSRAARRAVCAALAATTCLSVNVMAGPPYQTDDPEPPDKGHWELFFAAAGSIESRDVSGTLPQLEINYGAIENLQVGASLQLACNVTDNRVVTYGPGDVELSAKYRFLTETSRRPQVAVFPRLDLPTGDNNRGLGNGNVRFFLPVWVQKSWGPWCAFGGGGYWFNPGSDNRNWAYAGAVLQRDFGQAVSVGAELFFYSAGAKRRSERARLEPGIPLALDK